MQKKTTINLKYSNVSVEATFLIFMYSFYAPNIRPKNLTREYLSFRIVVRQVFDVSSYSSNINLNVLSTFHLYNVKTRKMNK